MAIAPSSAVTLAGAEQAVRAGIAAAQKSGLESHIFKSMFFRFGSRKQALNQVDNAPVMGKSCKNCSETLNRGRSRGVHAGWKVSVAICDVGGNLIALHRMDTCETF